MIHFKRFDARVKPTYVMPNGHIPAHDQEFLAWGPDPEAVDVYQLYGDIWGPTWIAEHLRTEIIKVLDEGTVESEAELIARFGKISPYSPDF